MPKIKTNRAAAKRFRVTGTGKIKRNKGLQTAIFFRAKVKSANASAQGDHGGRGGSARTFGKLIPYK